MLLSLYHKINLYLKSCVNKNEYLCVYFIFVMTDNLNVKKYNRTIMGGFYFFVLLYLIKK